MHIMNLIREHEGTEEWLCPECGRHMLVNWSPKFKRTILEMGDQSAGHSGAKGDLRIDSAQHVPQKESDLSIEDPGLVPWKVWLDEVGFENLWNSKL